MRFSRGNEATMLKVRNMGQYTEDVLMSIETKPRAYRPSRISIDFKALEHNFSELKKLVSPSKLSVAVKANAYGHGLVEISKRLEQLGVDMLCVATAEEALELRRANINCAIIILSEPPREAIGQCYLHDITFSVYTLEAIDTIAAHASKDKKAHVHLKIDTGMNRVGINPSEALKFARYIHNHESLFFEGIFTHFATADEPGQPGTSMQLQKFESVLDEVEMAGLTPPIIHAANSAAAISMPSTRFSMVRVGIAMYGIYPDAKSSDIVDLEQVLSLSTEISYLKTIKPGDSVSYGARYTAVRDTKVATLPIGYGDGVPRNLGTAGGHVLIYGTRCPIIGRVTMDQTMVDVTNVTCNVGDKVILLGQSGNAKIAPTEWGDLLGTISYEMICNLSGRLEHIYD
ncbi:MAG: alanine racemase [Acidimicrobiia bacterium]